MQLTPLFFFAALLIGAGAAATALVTRIYPLWFLGIAQEHGRYAGLGSSEPRSGGGTGKNIPTGTGVNTEGPVAGLIVA